MLYSNVLLALTGVCVVSLSACAPRQSLRQGHYQPASSQIQSSQRTTSQPIGTNGYPLYTSSTINTAQRPNTVSRQNLPKISTGTTTAVVRAHPAPPAPYPASEEMRYMVQKGETVYSIGRKFNVHPKHIISRNQMGSPNALSVGQSLILPKRKAVQNIQAMQYDSGLQTGTVKKNIPVYNAPQKVIPEYPKQHNASHNMQYVVEKGDTIYSIGRKFNMHPKYIMHKNPYVNPNQIKPGQVLNMVSNNHVKVTDKPSQTAQFDKPKVVIPEKTKDTLPTQLDDLDKQILANALKLPVKGAIKEDENMRGILITASDGDAVKASAAGEVIYVGNLNNYGNMVLLRHDNGLVTNYARLKKTFVQKGQKVAQGDLIAAAGLSKDFKTSDVLFEVRKGTKSVNPLDYIG